jgi:hypothetical protein
MRRVPPSYRERLRVEGFTLAALGAVASVAMVAAVPASRRWPLNTVGQVAVVAVLLEALGARAVRGYLDKAEELSPGEEGTGEPTPLWMLPPIVASLTASFVLLPKTGLPGSDAAGWDAGLRITSGCAVVGLAQALRFGGIVAAREQATGRRYLRVKGSKLFSGTKLGYLKS